MFEALHSGQESSVEYRIIRPDGSVRWISARGRRQPGMGDAPARLMGVNIDVTQSKLVEQDLKELRDRLQAESDYLQQEIGAHTRFDGFIGESNKLLEVLQRIERVAPTDSVVLITGETGTGKELVARAIHGMSQRKHRVMVKVDCASLPSTLIENELFGREKGAYTGALTRQIGRFELADGSTLFLDEIGELPLDLQGRLLRVIECGEFERLGSPKTIKGNVRVIAATNRDLAQRVKEGTFREDLFYRLNVVPIHVPPLRERADDIPLLVRALVKEFEATMHRRVGGVPAKIMQALQRHSWPGNVRELRNVIEKGVILSDHGQLHLPALDSGNAVLPTTTLRVAEYQQILKVLESTSWRIKGRGGAAELLGMKPSTLYTTMQRLSIPTKHGKDGIPT